MKINSEKNYMWFTVLIVAVGTFMASLDSSIVNVAIPKMMAVFGVSIDAVQWVVTGYMLTLGMVIPLSGYLADRFGSKTVFTAALMIFTLGSALCGLSGSLEMLVASRVLQAIGGGMIMPVGMTILFKAVPLEKRGTALGVWGISMFAAPAAGPVISGCLVQYSDWRLIFYINLPIGILAILSGVLILKETEKAKGKKPDIPGAVTAAAGLFTLLLALSRSSSVGWGSTDVLMLLTISAILLAVFTIIELKSRNPLIDLKVLKVLPYTAGLAASSIAIVAMFGIIFFAPIYFQSLKGYTAIHTAFILMISALAMAPVTVLGGKLFDRFGARWISAGGLMSSALTLGILSRVMTMKTDDLTLILFFSFCSMGMGFAIMPMQTASLNAVPREMVSRASALFRTMLQVSGSLGIALMTTLMQGVQPLRLSKSIQALSNITVNVHDIPAGQITQDGFARMASQLGVSMESLVKVFKDASVLALDDTFLVLAFVMITGIAFALLLPAKAKKIGE